MSRLIILLAVASLAALFAALFIGATPLAMSDVAAALLGVGAAGDEIVIWEIRLPRALAAYAVGAALGMSGAALQGLLRNPLAEPGVLGVSATASLFAAVAIYWGLSARVALAAPLCAVLGGVLATALLAFASARANAMGAIILAGVALSSFSGAMMALLLNLAPNPFWLSDLINWTLGTVANRSLDDLAMAAPLLAMGCALLWFSRRSLSALALGEEAAAGVGVDLPRARLLVIVGAGFAAGAAVSLAGIVGFVGLVAPHLVRGLVDHDPARTLAPAALLAGTALTVCDILVRIAPTQTELSLGVVAALFGAPVFVLIALRGGLARE